MASQTDCAICVTCSKDQLKRIKEAYSSGNSSPKDISKKESLELEAISYHCKNCLEDIQEDDTSVKEILSDLRGQLTEIIDLSKVTYKSSPDRSDLALAAIRAIQEMRDLAGQVNDLKNPSDMVKSSVEFVVNPLIQNTLILLAKELKQGFKDMEDAGIITDSSKAEQYLKKILKNVSSQLSPSVPKYIENFCSKIGLSKKETSKLVSKLSKG